jgi:hypothetical protein
MDEMIEKALRGEEELPAPGAFFRYAVMRRIRGEAQHPSLRFPWARVVALAAVGAVAGAFVIVPVSAATFGVLALLAIALVVPAVATGT